MEKHLHEDIKRATKELMKTITEQGIEQGNNLEYLSDLIDINKDIAEMEYYDMKVGEEDMRYSDYRRDDYGRRDYDRDSYGARRRDSRGRYRGHDYLDEMSEHYGRYMEDRSRYGASEDTKKSLKYMLESMEDFAHMLREDAQSQEEIDMIRQTAQRIAQM